MGTPSVQINRLNMMQGEFREVERYLCFVARGTNSAGTLQTVNTDTDLDEKLGSASSVLKTQLDAARANAGQNWNACYMEYADDQTWEDAVDLVMQQTSVEGLVLVEPMTDAAQIEAVQKKVSEIMAQYMRPVFFMVTARALDAESETWGDYVKSVSALTSGIKADSVSIVPYLWGMDPGTYAGRLCNKAVTVADSPMRVNTGALQGSWSKRPKDVNGHEIDRSVLKSLADARFSVPWWYPDYEGTYWADGALLDVSGGDYQVIENLRVVQKAMRRVYPLIVARIADRRLNSTPVSIAENQSYFMRPLREMAKSVQILGNTFPGEVKPPQDGDIVLSWPTRTSVKIYMTARPYNCPKSIGCNLMLDLKNYA